MGKFLPLSGLNRPGHIHHTHCVSHMTRMPRTPRLDF